ncbi:DoxX family protein [Serinibacter arcticus]|uniref:DoxX family protein n=1 Tax=Serinibacter arcticus TaxID=1655435 RepID=A0A2U1ZWY3_9MICO|nr:DoxX family protein [Serinibacter arcticus]PWD51474.1 DoxX family protein [Serinibacter arcticus]
MSATAQRATTSTTTTLTAESQASIVTSPLARKVLAFSRIVIGFFFLWPFLDKTFGLGFSTPAERAWINGGTPAQGFLKGMTGPDGTSPFKGFFELFINPFGDVLFMAGLLGIGVAMLAGAGLRIAAVSGTLLMIFMYLAEWPVFVAGSTNPILDSHWVEACLLLIAAATLAGDTWGLGKWWGGLDLVKKNRWLR